MDKGARQTAEEVPRPKQIWSRRGRYSEMIMPLVMQVQTNGNKRRRQTQTRSKGGGVIEVEPKQLGCAYTGEFGSRLWLVRRPLFAVWDGGCGCVRLCVYLELELEQGMTVACRTRAMSSRLVFTPTPRILAATAAKVWGRRFQGLSAPRSSFEFRDWRAGQHPQAGLRLALAG